jgi:hypothetical protein
MLDNPRFLPKDFATKHFNPILHLWISPTFAPDKHWVFYKPIQHLNPLPKPIIRQIIWQKQNDYERLHKPLTGLKEGFHIEPSLQINSIEIEQKMLQTWLENLSKINFPAFSIDEHLGLDGERFGIETFGFFNSAKITWWSSYPEEWQEIVTWYEKVRKFLEEKFK